MRKETTPKNSHQTLKITTLGHFSVQTESCALSKEFNKSKKIWELFMYFITNRKKNLSPEVLREALWPESDLDFSQCAFRTLIYRLRRVLKGAFPIGSNINPIIFAQGCYHWNTEMDYWLDIEEIERLCSEANELQESDPEKAIDLYQIILELYNGDYLQELLYAEWTIPTRNYYRRLYLQAMRQFLHLLSKFDLNTLIIETCQKIILHEALEEDFYIYLIEALLKQKNFAEAKATYDQVTSMLKNELGIKPSPEMYNLRFLIKSSGNPKSFTQKGFILPPSQRPLFCDKKTFSVICDLEKRKSERSKHPVILILMMLKTSQHQIKEKNLDRMFFHLKKTLDDNLRREDVYTTWDDHTIALILQDINLEFATKVMNRIKKAYIDRFIDNTVTLKIEYRTISSPQEHMVFVK